MGASKEIAGGVAFRSEGHGEPVMALHCSGACGGAWKGLSSALRHRYTVVTPDRPGYGSSEPVGAAEPMSLAAEARMFAGLAVRWGRPVHLVGHSYGGAVALRAALDFPSLFRSLTLIEPVSFHLLRDKSLRDRRLFGEIAELAADIAEAASNGDPDKAAQRFVDYWNGPGAWARLSDDRRKTIARDVPRIGTEIWAAMQDGMRFVDAASITIPTLIVAGQRSPAPARRISERLAASVSNGWRATMADAGHMLPMTHGETLAGLILDHLDTTGDPAFRQSLRHEVLCDPHEPLEFTPVLEPPAPRPRLGSEVSGAVHSAGAEVAASRVA